MNPKIIMDCSGERRNHTQLTNCFSLAFFAIFLQSFRDRAHGFQTTLDCYGTYPMPRAQQQPRATAPPPVQQASPQPSEQASAPPQAAMVQAQAPPNPYYATDYNGAPVYFDHDQEGFRNRQSYRTSLDVYGSAPRMPPRRAPVVQQQQAPPPPQQMQQAPPPAPQQAPPPQPATLSQSAPPPSAASRPLIRPEGVAPPPRGAHARRVAPIYYDHDQEGFRDRVSTFQTSLDCWS